MPTSDAQQAGHQVAGRRDFSPEELPPADGARPAPAGGLAGRTGNASLEAYQARASWLHSLAENLYVERRYSESDVVVRQLLALQEREVGTGHPDYALGLCMLGELRFLLNDRDGAETCFRVAIEIRRATLGDRHPDYATALACLGGLLWRRGQWEQAETLFREALIIRWQALGERHPDSVQNRKELARLLRRRGDWAGAQALLLHELARSQTPVSPNHRGKPFSGDVVVMSGEFARLGDDLARAANGMLTSGEPLPPKLFEAIRGALRDYSDFRDVACRWASSLRVPCPPPDALGSLQDVAAIVDEIADAEMRQGDREGIRRRALAILDRVSWLAHRHDADFPPLRNCQQRARELRDAIANAHWTVLPTQAERIVEGDHTLVALLALIESMGGLSDDSWAALHEEVSRVHGKALASAASRGKLYVKEPIAPVEEPSAAARGPGAVESPLSADPFALNPVLAGMHRSDSRFESNAKVANLPGQSNRTEAGPLRSDRPVASEPQITAPDRNAELVQDLAVASLVPTMGRIINVPEGTHAPAESKPCRLFRVGEAPAVVAPSSIARLANELTPERPRKTNARDITARFATVRRLGPGVVAGPLALPHPQPDPEPTPRERRDVSAFVRSLREDEDLHRLRHPSPPEGMPVH